MAEAKEGKIMKNESRTLAEGPRGGLLASFVSESAQLAERTVGTCFGIVRDVRVELNQRVLGTIQFVESTQQGVFKILRGVDERIDSLGGDALDTAEGFLLGIIRTVGEAGHGVTAMADQLTRPRETQRAA
jgi:hypothetical protein